MKNINFKKGLLPGVFALVLIFFCGEIHSTVKDSVAEKYANTILAEDLSRHLHVIASDEYEGRETGQKGQKMAAAYLAGKLKESGVAPVNGSYFQEFPLRVQYPEGVEFSIMGKEYRFMKDYFFMRGFDDTTISTTGIVFAGYGIDDEKYTDYPAQNPPNVQGKVVMFLSGEPTTKNGISLLTGKKKASEWTTNWRLKLETAKARGAVAALIISPDIYKSIATMRHFIEKPSMKLDSEEKSSRAALPNFTVSREMADAVFSSQKTTTEKLARKIRKKKKTKTVSSSTQLSVRMNRKADRLTSENVVGFIEGSDLKDEIIVLSAHYDHLGKSDTVVYNGADDDGSGTVALLELAEAFSAAKQDGHGPRRSILILPFAGEEKGLLGSEFYTENPLFPLEKTVADLNIDMIGRIDEKHNGNPDYIYLIGSDKLSTELHKISENANAVYTKLEIDYTFNDPDDQNRFYYRSDHYNFAKNKIPVIFYFNGVHEDYHKPTDEVEKINFAKMEKITRLVFYTAWDLANRNERIRVDVKNDF